MDYATHYERLIERAKNRAMLNGYVERHHIIPRCMGGTNAHANIAILTAAEHFVAHQLLVKIHPNKPSLIYAARRLACAGKVGSNKQYAWIRKRAAALASALHSGKQLSAEHKEKLRIANTGREMPLHVKEKLRQTNCGTKRSPETCAKICCANTERMRLPETRAHLSQLNKGKRLSEETRAKMSASRKGRVVSDATREKISAAHKGKRNSGMFGRSHSPETRAKMSVAAKEREAKKRQSDAHRQ